MDGIDLMASAMHAMQTRLDIAAGNLANAASDGFRRTVAHVGLGRGGLETRAGRDETGGPLRRTGRNLDLSVVSSGGGMLVRDGAGRTATVRSAAFERTQDGAWRDGRGRVLLGESGPLRAEADATVDARGVVAVDGKTVGRLHLVRGTTLESGLLEASNVDAVHEMVDILGAQRAFETAQKTLSAIDDVRGRATSDVARVKS